MGAASCTGGAATYDPGAMTTILSLDVSSRSIEYAVAEDVGPQVMRVKEVGAKPLPVPGPDANWAAVHTSRAATRAIVDLVERTNPDVVVLRATARHRAKKMLSLLYNVLAQEVTGDAPAVFYRMYPKLLRKGPVEMAMAFATEGSVLEG